MDSKKAVRVYHRNLAILIGLILLAFILVPMMVKSPYTLNIFVLTFYMSTLSMAWNLLGGMTGQNSLGHAAYMGLGAYACCLLVVKTGANPWLAAIFGMAVVGLVAGIVFYPCFILRGPYFTLVSIAFGESIRQLIINSEFFGRASGVGLPFGQDSWLNFRFGSKIPYYYVGLIMMVGIYLIMKKIDRSKIGFALKTIREDEDAAAAIGINPTKYKIMAVVISAMVAGLVGFFYASYIRYIDPDLMIQAKSTESVLPAVVGGAAFVEGPIVGGLIMIPLSEYLRANFSAVLPGINMLMYAVVLLAVIRFRPTGVLGWYMHSKTKRFKGLTAVKDVSFSIKEGSITGMIGPNGAGKSTTFNMICGYYPPTEGRIFYKGEDITDKKAFEYTNMKIARTFQIMKPLKNLSVLDNVVASSYFGHAGAKSEKEARERAMDVLQFTGLYEKRHVLSKDMGTPDQKRLEMARALATKPEMLFLDENMAGLNPAERGDHAGDAATGRSEAERLISQEKVDVMMGCHMSVVTEVVAQVCQQNGVPMITAISTLDRLSNEEHKDMDYFFRLCPLNSVYVENMLMYLKDSAEQTGEEIKTVAIFTDRAAIGQELIRCVELFKDKYGIELVATVDYTSNATDLSAQVLALKQANPDAILCDFYIGDATLFIQTLKEQNYSPKMIVAKANGFTDPSFITNLGAISNGVASVVEFNPDLVNGVEINKEFKDEYGVDMNGHSAESYTVVCLFKTAIEAAGSTDGEAVKNALAELDIQGEFPGGRRIILPYDQIKFENYDLAGEPHYRDNTAASVAIAQIQDGEWKTVWPFSFTETKIVYPAPLQ